MKSYFASRRYIPFAVSLVLLAGGCDDAPGGANGSGGGGSGAGGSGAGGSGGSPEPDGSARESHGSDPLGLMNATEVWVSATGTVDAGPEEIPSSEAMFIRASNNDARRIAQLMGDPASYMEFANACFDRHAEVRFRFADGSDLYATVGFICWNVRFSTEGEPAPAPGTGYLEPGKLNELAAILETVDPSVDTSIIEF